MNPLILPFLLLSFTVIPESPSVGDVVKIAGDANPNEGVAVKVTFEKTVPVSGGRYEFSLKGVEIPDGRNSFTVTAYGCEDLSVSVKFFLIWITRTSKAENGVARISQSNVPAGSYDIKIHGKSSSSSVRLVITAVGYVKADENGKFEYSYDTSSVPPGKFVVKVGSSTKTVYLGERSGQGTTSTSTQPAETPTTTLTTTALTTTTATTTVTQTVTTTPTPTAAETATDTTATPIQTPNNHNFSFQPSVLAIAAKGNETVNAELKIFGTANWTLRSDVNWIHFNRTSGSGSGVVEVTVNTTGLSGDSKAKIILDAGNQSYEVPVFVEVTQTEAQPQAVETNPRIPGFEAPLAIFTLLVVYLLRRMK